MEGTPAIYLNRIVSKEHFRAFIYSHDGSKKLVESWDEFEEHMQSGVWFATADEAKRSQETPKPLQKSRTNRAKKETPVTAPELKEDALIEELEESILDDKVFEVKDDFLPKGA